MKQIRYHWAGREDEADLRAVLRQVAMPGQVSVAMHREPDFFLGATIEGDVHDVLIAREVDSHQAVGVGSRSVLAAYLNGVRRPLGYFSQLRLLPQARGMGVVSAGFEWMRQRHDRGRPDAYITTIIADNKLARRALLAGRPGMPRYLERAAISSLAIPVWRRRRLPRIPGVLLRRARAEDLPDLANCLNQHNRRFQFAPHWTADDLASERRTRGLAPEQIFLAERQGRIIGSAALWDQTAYKQIVVHDLAGPLRWLRPAINLAGPLFGVPTLPRAGEAFRFAFVSHLAAPIEEVDLWRALITAVANSAVDQRLGYISLGLADRHPRLRGLARAFAHINYRAILCTVHWPDGQTAVAELDDRLPHVETAIL